MEWLGPKVSSILTNFYPIYTGWVEPNLPYGILFIVIFTPLKRIYVDFKYKQYKDNKDKHKTFTIFEEPNRNLFCEPFSTKETFIGYFIDHEGNIKYMFFMRYDKRKVKRIIEKLDKDIRFNSNKIDDIQVYLSSNPNASVQELERYNHLVKQDMASLRKLESFYKQYDKKYVSKPEYPGEERDNVNTY